MVSFTLCTAGVGKGPSPSATQTFGRARARWAASPCSFSGWRALEGALGYAAPSPWEKVHLSSGYIRIHRHIRPSTPSPFEVLPWKRLISSFSTFIFIQPLTDDSFSSFAEFSALSSTILPGRLLCLGFDSPLRHRDIFCD
ncbi:hypothetical protein FZEAL_2366 [Fusarium zealandicum]|uniref:Uncharacterized protein n=1 Tax=Fusarium zealandicum TaxID=1053134 RepID=A0A8H4XNH9_9HYPO|nr:hypothetical protein FZEAL_2366 [Fusarium zealandicum]